MHYFRTHFLFFLFLGVFPLFVQGQDKYCANTHDCCAEIKASGFGVQKINHLGNGLVAFATSITPNDVFGVNCKATLRQFKWNFGNGTEMENVKSGQHQFALNNSCRGAVQEITLCGEFEMPQDSINIIFHCSVTVAVVIDGASNSDYTINLDNQSCGVAKFSFSKTNPNAPDIIDPVWTFGDGLTGAGFSTNHTYPGNGTYTVALTDGGNPDLCPVFRTITIDNIPSLDFTYSTDCSNTASFVISNYDPGAKYTWSFGGQKVIANSSTATYTFGGPGNFKVRLTGNKPGFCSSTIVKTVNAGGVSAHFGLTTPICVGDYLDVKGVMPGGATYQWELIRNNGSSVNPGPPDGLHPIYAPASPGLYTLKLTATSANGCVQSSEKSLEVLSPQSLVNPISASQCGAEEVNVDISPANSATIDFGDGTVITASSTVSHVYAQPGQYTVQIQALDPCISPYQKNIIVSASPSLEINAPAAVFCPGDQVVVHAIVNNPTNGVNYIYEWKDPQGNTVGNKPGLTIKKGGQYTVSVASGGACTNQTFTESVNITELAEPTASIGNITGVSCPGAADGVVTLSVSAELSKLAYTINGQPAPANVTTFPLDNLTEGNNYLLIAYKDYPACYSMLRVNVPYAGPSLSLESAPSDCKGPNGRASVVGGDLNHTYQWVNVQAPNQDLGVNSPNATGLAAGVYSVSLTDDNGCTLSGQVEVPRLALNLSLKDLTPIACAGSTTEVEVKARYSPAYTVPSLTYTWEKSDGNNGWTKLNFSGKAVPLGAGRYRVSAQDSQTGCSSDLEFDVTAVEPLSLAWDMLPGYCPGDTARVEALVSGGSGNYHYEWTINDINLGKLIDVPAIYLPAVGAIPVSVKVTDPIGCSATLRGTVESLSGTPVEYQGVDPINDCSLTVNVKGGQAPYNFDWYQLVNGTAYEVATQVIDEYKDGKLINTIIDTLLAVKAVDVENLNLVHSHVGGVKAETTLEPFSPGIYLLMITDAYGCTDTASVNLDFKEIEDFPDFAFVWGRVDLEEEEEEPEPDPIIRENMAEAQTELFNAFDECLAKAKNSFSVSLDSACFNLDNFSDQLTLSYGEKLDHFTLYYYDRAGQLTKTVPPAGVRPLSKPGVDSLKDFRYNNVPPNKYKPDHLMETRYFYNSLGQLQKQETPDGGVTRFIYDELSRLRFSQNAQQALDGTFSYTKYDRLGRIVEVGESADIAGLDFSKPTAQTNETKAKDIYFPDDYQYNSEVTRTTYSDPAAVDYYGRPQRYLQNRISKVCLDEDGDFNSTHDQYCAYYSYDPHGNVEWLVQDDPVIGPNYIAYEYDLVSGNVLKVRYNEYREDAFFHRYAYDPENRIDTVWTSRDGQLWDRDAHYDYYTHGPLKRTLIGEDKVQGLDYIYTIHGWLKGVNTPQLNPGLDPGGDGYQSSYTDVAPDAFGMTLGFYENDFNRDLPYLDALKQPYGNTPQLYNGNIPLWIHSQIEDDGATPQIGGYQKIAPRASQYSYDLLNRIRDSENRRLENGAWTYPNSNFTMDHYRTAYEYDANGNIEELLRYDSGGNLMDDLTYTYDNPNNNRLSTVADAAAVKLDDKGDLVDNHDYTYDAIGNLILDDGKEKLDLDGDGIYELYKVRLDMEWTAYGKVRQVVKTIYNLANNPIRRDTIRFHYDPNGNRIRKVVMADENKNLLISPDEIAITSYVRDAEGNPLAICQIKNNGPDNSGQYESQLSLIEQPIYGADRLGMNRRPVLLATAPYVSEQPIAFQPPADGFLVRSEYQNWITSSTRELLPGGEQLCESRITRIEFDPDNNNTFGSNSDLGRLMGVVENGVAVAENFQGELQFYVVLAENYLGGGDACLLFDRDGNLMEGTEQIAGVNPHCKPIVAQLPGSPHYLVLTINADQHPEYHVVDMSALGYGGQQNAGAVILANQPVEIPPVNTTYGLHFSGYEDHIGGRSIVYHTRYTPSIANPEEGTTELLAYEFSGSYFQKPQTHLLHSVDGCGPAGRGELQISPDGERLAWYRHDRSISAFAQREHRLHLLELDVLRTSTLSAHTIEGHPSGNYGDGSLDFLTNAEDLFFSQRGVYEDSQTNSEKNTWKYQSFDPGKLDPVNPNSLYLYSEIRRGVDERFYVPVLEEKADQIQSFDAAATSATAQNLFYNFPLPASDFQFASGLPTQVYKIGAAATEAPYDRFLAKSYELKDHLGNVRVVIGDGKTTGDAGIALTGLSAEMQSYSDGYPFGMGMDGREFKSRNYRFGFNGKEKDDSDGNILDFGERLYGSRTARWTIPDPLLTDFPNWSSYHSFFNNPILYIDPNGEKGKITIITYEEETGNSLITSYETNLIKAGGEREVWFGNASRHYEIDYYDYQEVIYRTVDASGNITTRSSKTKILLSNGIKDSDINWGGKSTGDLKKEFVFSLPDLKVNWGLMIYGDASSSKDSPGIEIAGIPWGSFDFSEFMEIMDLAMLGINDKDGAISTDADLKTIYELIQKVEEVVDYNKSNSGDDESEESKSGSDWEDWTVNKGDESRFQFNQVRYYYSEYYDKYLKYSKVAFDNGGFPTKVSKQDYDKKYEEFKKTLQNK